MPKQVMIQTVMSLDDFAFCQRLFREIVNKPVSESEFLYSKKLYFESYELECAENLRRIFLPDIKII